MSATFEVGQKVEHIDRGEVEITYGPFTGSFGSQRYLVRIAEGKEVAVSPGNLSAIPVTPKFSVGDVVTLATRPTRPKATVEYGPFDDREVYVVKLVDEPADEDEVRTFTAMAHVMTAVPEPEPLKVGDRVRVVKDDRYNQHGEFVGRTGVLRVVYDDDRVRLYKVKLDDPSGTWDDGSWWCAEVERAGDDDTYTHDGVTYDLSARYLDEDGDEWAFRRRGSVVQAQTTPVADWAWGDFTLPYVIATYGPLTRIDA
ncbi:phiSA1p31-related protein [Streptomyces sp. NPDC002491]